MNTIKYRTADVDSFTIFYREAGAAEAPKLLLVHGFPSASHMFRDLIPRLSDRFHIIAPDLPGFGKSDMPRRGESELSNYTFDRIAATIDRFTEVVGFDRYAVYVFDYGAPTGFRLAVKHPDRITAIISQNGNAYEEGLSESWNPIRAYWEEPSPANRQALRSLLAPETTVWQYTHGVRDPTAVSPDGYSLDNFYLTRSGADELQLDLFGDYKSNVALYPTFQEYSAPTSRRSSRCGARMIRSFCRRAPKPSSATFPRQLSASSTPDTSRWKRIPQRLRQQSGSSFPAEFHNRPPASHLSRCSFSVQDAYRVGRYSRQINLAGASG
jgi:pimeloyl-ACP methyl ester carboxylesterase